MFETLTKPKEYDEKGVWRGLGIKVIKKENKVKKPGLENWNKMIEKLLRKVNLAKD